MRYSYKTCLGAMLCIAFMFAACSDDEQDNRTVPLFSLIIPEEYTIGEKRQLWFMLSDENGNLLDVQQAVPGTVITFKTPKANADQRFTLTRFDGLKSTVNQEHYGFESFTQMKPGEYSLPKYEPYSEPESKDFTAKISGMASGDYVNICGTGIGGYSGYDDGNTTVMVADLMIDKTNLVYTINNFNDPTVQLYKYVEGATGNESISLNKKDFAPMNLQLIPVDKSYPSGYVDLYGYSSDDTRSTGFPITSVFALNQKDFTALKIFYPGNSFPAYRASLSISTEKEGWHYTKKGSIPKELKKLNVTLQNITLSNNKITGNKTGSFDYLTAFIRSTISEGENYYALRWNVHQSDANNTITIALPEIPKQILEQYPKLGTIPQKSITYVSAKESNGLTDYDHFVEENFKNLARLVQRKVPKT